MQPSQDLLSVARRPLDVEDYIDIVRRHKAWIVGPAFAALVIAVVAAFLWPDTYISEASVQVVPPQVPERYVASNINSEMTERIQLMANTILSRNNLVNVINDFGLYRKEVSRGLPMEDIYEKMYGAIRVSPVGNLQAGGGGHQVISAFKLTYSYSNRYLAQKVAAKLVSDFVLQNIRTLSDQSAATTDFLKDQLDAAKKRLGDLENQVTQFRMKNAGRLPDELQANLQMLRGLETQLSGVNEQISRIGQEKLMLENQIRIYKDQLAALGSGSDPLSVSAKNERLQQLDRDILNLEAFLSGLRQRYSESHPDVKTAEAQMAVLQRRRDDLLKQEQDADKKKAPPAPVKPNLADIRGAQELEASISRLESQIQVRNIELEERTKSQKQLNSLIDSYNSRIQASPVMERDYAELTRDFNLAKAKYDELNAKKAQSEIATTLENQGRGERLQLLDQASLPETPVKPNRWMIVGAGLGMGLMLGVFVAGAREMKDTSLKNLKDARAYTNLPVLGTIPLLENDLVVRRKRRLAWLAWSVAGIVGIVAMAGSVYYYLTTRV
jgi:polysaccharide chain length determinant protein (PEP-CTERM system associated)